jgi:hypothetical protein
VGQILAASKEAQIRPALPGDMVANCAPQHWVLNLKCRQDRILGYRAINFKLNLVAHLCQCAQMGGDYYSY